MYDKNVSINTRYSLIAFNIPQSISVIMDWHLFINDISHMSERKAHDEIIARLEFQSFLSSFLEKGVCAEIFFSTVWLFCLNSGSAVHISKVSGH